MTLISEIFAAHQQAIEALRAQETEIAALGEILIDGLRRGTGSLTAKPASPTRER